MKKGEIMGKKESNPPPIKSHSFLGCCMKQKRVNRKRVIGESVLVNTEKEIDYEKYIM